MANSLRVGRISGNPSSGLCERICIEVDRVFDGCKERVNNSSFVLTLASIPNVAVPPYTFVSATSYGDVTVENVETESAQNGKSRIECDVVIPVSVIFADSRGERFGAVSSIRLHREFLLTLPARSVTPYSLRVFVAFESRIGNFVSENSVAVNGCYVLVAKIIVPTDVLVPIYGYCSYRECASESGGVCNAFLSLPLFPE